jgi:hypothetical protein
MLMFVKQYLALAGKGLAAAGLAGIVSYLVSPSRTDPTWPYAIFIGLVALGMAFYLAGQRQLASEPHSADTTHANDIRHHEPDRRSLNFAGDVDEQGRPLPMNVEILRGRTEKWPRSPHTPVGVAALLARSRQMFVDGYYTYENFTDAATKSLQAVEAALRVRFDAGGKSSFFQLIDRAKAEGIVDDYTNDVLHAGRMLRNREIHATAISVLNPATAAAVIGASHKLVAEVFENAGKLANG